MKTVAPPLKNSSRWDPLTELGSTAVQKYRGTVTRYFFSTVIGTVDTFQKMYRFWYRRYFLDRFTRYFGNFFLSKLRKAQSENFPGFSAKSIFEKYRETTL